MVTLAEQIQDAQRELALRERAFPGWVKAGRLSMDDAYHRLAVQRAIVATLTRLEVEQQQLSLFSLPPA
jgi:hypothetical protein